ncbi:hypothetical protein PIB30_037290 [Stylosanthes scabra]|uniref:Uncharacterized protein n=1 Tax=Stylosanthes scabra TaxID=79078 RepID=A0ABU6WEL8_9FABA|nr:hypothetical protein [Stylosanthes scabra]
MAAMIIVVMRLGKVAKQGSVTIVVKADKNEVAKRKYTRNGRREKPRERKTIKEVITEMEVAAFAATVVVGTHCREGGGDDACCEEVEEEVVVVVVRAVQKNWLD